MKLKSKTVEMKSSGIKLVLNYVSESTIFAELPKGFGASIDKDTIKDIVSLIKKEKKDVVLIEDTVTQSAHKMFSKSINKLYRKQYAVGTRNYIYMSD